MKILRSKTEPLFTLDHQGQMDFPFRRKEARNADKPDSIWENSLVTALLVLGCALVDMVMMLQIYNSFLSDRAVMRWLSTIGCLVAYDMVPIYIGLAKKKKEQGFKVNENVVRALMAVFGIVFIFTTYLRIVTRSHVIPVENEIGGFTTTFGMQESAVSENPIALPFALVASVIPLGTSIVSYAIGYFTLNPLKTRIKRLQIRKVDTEDKINKLEATLKEHELNKTLKERLITEDEAKYLSAKEIISNMSYGFRHYVREQIAERLGNPTSTNILTDHYEWDKTEANKYTPEITTVESTANPTNRRAA